MDNGNNQRAVALIRILRLSGKTYMQMAAELNEQGFRTSRGRSFQASQVKRYSGNRIKLTLTPPPGPEENTIVSRDRIHSFRTWLNR